MTIPVRQRIIESLVQLLQGLKASSFERQRLQLLPPGFNQVQPAGVLGQELDLDLGPEASAKLTSRLVWITRLSSMNSQRSAGNSIITFP